MWREARWILVLLAATAWPAIAQPMFSDEWIRVAEYRGASECIAERHRLHVKVVRGSISLSFSRSAMRGSDLIFGFGGAACNWTGVISTAPEEVMMTALEDAESLNQQSIRRDYARDSSSCPDVDVYFTLQNGEFWLGITSHGEASDGLRGPYTVEPERILLNFGAGECHIAILALPR